MFLVGNHPDGDTDEISVILCRQRTRKRFNGELPRCYVLGWRHIFPHEVQAGTSKVPLPPKIGEDENAPTLWKERTLGDMENISGPKSDPEFDDHTFRVTGPSTPKEHWNAGNYVWYGRGSVTAHEKIEVRGSYLFLEGNLILKQSMNVPLQAYEAHRRKIEHKWSLEQLDAYIKKQEAKELKRARRQAELDRPSGASPAVPATTSASSSASLPTISTSTHSEQASASSGESTTTAAPATVPAPTATSAASPSTSPPAPPTSMSKLQDQLEKATDSRSIPWYRRMFDRTPSPTHPTLDDRTGHRLFLLPHPLRFAKTKLERSWSIMLTPTFKFVTLLSQSFTSGDQARFRRKLIDHVRSGDNARVWTEVRTIWDATVQKEQERLEAELRARQNTSGQSANGQTNQSSSNGKDEANRS